MGPKVIVRVEEGTVSADGMLTVRVLVTRAVAVLDFSQLLSKPEKKKQKFGRVKYIPSERCCQVRVKDVRHLQISSAEFLGSLTVVLEPYKEIILDTQLRLGVHEHGSI